MTSLDPNIEKFITQKVADEVSKKIDKVQIALLKEHFLTRDEFLTEMEKLDKRFEDMLSESNKQFKAMQEQMDKRFEQMDKRFEAMQEQMDKRFEQMDKRFEAMQEQMDKRFAKVYERFDQMDFGHTDIVAGVAYIVIKREFRNRGLEFDLKSKHHFTDEQNFVFPDTSDVEVDIFHVKPNIIGEVTLKVTDLAKVRSFIRKIQFVEKRYHDQFQRYFFCYTIEDSIRADAERVLKQYDIELIIPERENR